MKCESDFQEQRENRSTSSYKADLPSLQTNQISSAERGCILPFTFVPKSGTLPTQVSVGKDVKLSPQIVSCRKQEMSSYKPEGDSRTADGSPLKSWRQSSIEHKSSAEEVSSSGFKNAQQNDLFIAEFVFVVNYDEEEETDDKSKFSGGDSRCKQLSITPEPKIDTFYINEVFASEAQEDAFLHNVEYQDNGLQLHSYVSAVSSIPSKLQQESVIDSTNQSLNYNRQSKFNLSENQKHPITSNSVNLQEGYIAIKSDITDTAKDFSILDSDSLKDTHFTQSHIPHGKTRYAYSCKSPEAQNQGGPSLPLSSCQKSNVLSPLPIHIIKYPICRSPSPIQSPYYGSTSTLYSNPPSSYDQGSHVPSRLTFLTSLLRSKKLSHKRPFSPDSTQSYSVSNPDSLHPFIKKTINQPTISRKSLSCFSLDKPKEMKTVQFQKNANMLPSASESNILYAESSLHHRPIRALSPDSMYFKPSNIVHSHQKAGSIPLLHKSSTSPFSSKENISPLHVKPPLSKETYKPLKKYSVLGKSRKVTLSPPVSTYNLSNSHSDFDSQKQTGSQNKKKYVSSDDDFKTRYYKAKEDSFQMLAARHPTGKPILSTPFLQPTVNILQKSINDNKNPKLDISSSSHSNYRSHSNSLSLEELPRTNMPKCTSYNDRSPPMTALSRSIDLPSASSLSQCFDHSDNKKSYRIKSNYKAFAAIPTNTLLLDQKAIDEPELNEANAAEEKMETHSEMCSPAQLRQQTEEICAAIDEVLHDPLPLHRQYGSRSSKRQMAPKLIEMTKSPSRTPSTGRETKYASLQQRTTTKSSSATKPGVIRPITLKVCLDEQNEEMYHPYPSDHFTVTSLHTSGT
ncbi:muscular LMNA-interacting protein [Spea bombifrons]|uniref:muscular LMNA-interacting protein n=1 Tax=Spea bombifrons TaxID=233779 RepID=UPI002349A477|nr:muscular LMNA-interacting protein [Spea bombifrons]